MKESKIPPPFRNDEEWTIADAITNDPYIADNLPIMELKSASLKTTQRVIDPDIVELKVDDLTPIVVWKDAAGQHWIIDGNHRAKAHKKVDALVLDGSKPLNVLKAAAQMKIRPQAIVNAMYFGHRESYRKKYGLT